MTSLDSSSSSSLEANSRRSTNETLDTRQSTSIEYTATGNFAPILERLNVSLLVSTSQAGKLISVGSDNGQLQFAFHGFDQVMGVAAAKKK